MLGERKLCEKESAGWVNFYLYVIFVRMISTHHPFFLRACRVSFALPLFRPSQCVNSRLWLAGWQREQGTAVEEAKFSFRSLLSYSLACLTLSVNHK